MRESNHYAKMKKRTVVEDLQVSIERANILREAPRLVASCVARGLIPFPKHRTVELSEKTLKDVRYKHQNHLWDDGDYRRQYFSAKKEAFKNNWPFTWDKTLRVNTGAPMPGPGGTSSTAAKTPALLPS